jgi:hypothetical protein
MLNNTEIPLIKMHTTSSSEGIFLGLVPAGNKIVFRSTMVDASNKMEKEDLSYIFDDRKFHLFTIVREENRINVFVDDQRIPVISSSIKVMEDDDVFSNKKISLMEMSDSNSAYFASFGVYPSVMSHAQRELIYQSNESEFVKKTVAYQDLLAQYRGLKTEIETGESESPFQSKSVIDSCESVQDWSNMSSIVENASPICLTEIQKFCTAESSETFPDCLAWQKVMSLTSSSK